MKRLRDIRRAEGIEVTDAVITGGGFGVVTINGWKGSVIWGMDEDGWEHVSVAPFDDEYTPTWADMCRLKDIFWKENEAVIQIHPRKREYINIRDNCLHLWRPTEGALLEELEAKRA